MTTIHIRDELRPSDANVPRVPSSTVNGGQMSPRRLARLAGVLYLALAVCSFFGVWVSSRIVKAGDAAATADNIRSSTTLFRVDLIVELVGAVAFLLTAMALYVLLAHVHRLAAGAMVAIVTVSVAVMSLNLINHYAALKIATEGKFTGALGTAQADQLTLLFTDLKAAGFFLAQMTFGLWLLPLGYLVFRSGYFPRPLGVLLMVACLSYFVELSLYFLAIADASTVVTGTIEAVAELAFVVWLLVKGVTNDDAPPARGRLHRHTSTT